MARNSLKSVMRLIEDAKQTLEPEQAFLSDLKRSIELTDEKQARKPSQTYKPSSMQCIRQMYYQVIGKEPDVTGSSYALVGICNSGSDIHERIQTAVTQMQENNIDCEWVNVADFVKSRELGYLEIREAKGMETKLYHKTLNLSFMCDGIIKYKNKYYILELKTETGSKFFNRKEVDAKHYDQGTAYSIAFGIDDIIFVYISRDTLDMKAFMFTPTRDMKENLLSKIYECDEYVNKLIAPPKPVDIIKSVCTYCSYKESCRKDG